MEKEIYCPVANLLSFGVDSLFFDTTSTYSEVDQADEPVPRDMNGNVTNMFRGSGGRGARGREGPLPWADYDQRGQRHPCVVPAGYPHDGVAPRRPQARPFGDLKALVGLILEDQPGNQVRRRPFITGHVSSQLAAIAASSRSATRRAVNLHAPPDPVQQYTGRAQSQ